MTTEDKIKEVEKEIEEIKKEQFEEICDLQLRNIYHNVDECLCCEQTKNNIYEILEIFSKNQEPKKAEDKK